MCSQALIGLGSNVGDRKATLDGAIAALREIEGVNPRAVSSYHETQPVGGQPGQGAFLNAVAVLEPSLDAFGLLYALHWVEDQFLRERTFRWGERTLDLDLLLLGDEVCFNRELILPHPRFAYRRFVLAPAAEVAPNAVDPMSGHSIAELLENVNRRPSLVCIDHLDPNETPQRAKVIADVRNRLCERLNGVIVPHPGSGEIGRSRSTYRDMAEDRYRQLTMAAHALSPP